MLTLQLALRNLIGAGTRTWLNVAVTSFSFVVIIFQGGMYQGFLEHAREVTIESEVAGGAYWHPAYDPDDPLTLDESHGFPPAAVADQIAAGTAMPVLVIQGSIYPEGRMVPVLIKGIPPDQRVVDLPTEALARPEASGPGSPIPVLVGGGMARSANLEEGAVFTMLWRDSHGTYDAYEAEVVSIMQVENFNVDLGQVWVPLERLRQMAEAPGEATYVVVSRGTALLAPPLAGLAEVEIQGAIPREGLGGWHSREVDYFLRDITAMIETKKASGSVLYTILLVLAAMGIFNSQVLSIFRRRKEIGTLMALGMARSRVVGLFTTEGGLHSLLAFLLGALWGGPLIILVATKGIALPYDSGDAANMGILMGARIFPAYSAGLILGTTLLVAAIVTVVSYLPSRKIARMKPTQALSGRQA